MSRASHRLDTGRVSSRRAGKTKVQPGSLPGGSMTFPGVRRASLLRWVDRRVPERSRAALVADLLADERPGARDLGRELAERWDIAQEPAEGVTEEDTEQPEGGKSNDPDD